MSFIPTSSDHLDTVIAPPKFPRFFKKVASKVDLRNHGQPTIPDPDTLPNKKDKKEDESQNVVSNTKAKRGGFMRCHDNHYLNRSYDAAFTTPVQAPANPSVDAPLDALANASNHAPSIVPSSFYGASLRTGPGSADVHTESEPGRVSEHSLKSPSLAELVAQEYHNLDDAQKASMGPLIQDIYDHERRESEHKKRLSDRIETLNRQVEELTLQQADTEHEKAGRISIQSANATVAKVEAMSRSMQQGRSFAVRTLSTLIKNTTEDNPDLAAELTAVKEAVKAHEKGISISLANLESECNGQIFDGLNKIQKLEARVQDQDDFIKKCYHALDGYEAEVDIRGDAAAAWEREAVKLKEELRAANHSLVTSRRDQSKTIIRLEREKNTYVEKQTIMQQKLARERAKTKAAEQNEKIAKMGMDGILLNYDYYFKFYENHMGIAGGSERSRTSNDTQNTQPSLELSRSSLSTDENDIKTVTQTLRAKYLAQQLDSHSKTSTNEASKPPVSGAEFLKLANVGRHRSRTCPLPRTPSSPTEETLSVDMSRGLSNDSSSEFVRGVTLIDGPF